MNQKVIAKGKEIIKDHIRSIEPGLTVRISVEDEANLAVFQQARNAPDIQRMLTQKRVSVEFYIPDLVGQARNQMMSFIRGANSQVEKIIFPYLPEDYQPMKEALESTEVQSLLRQRGITASLRRVNNQGEFCPSIIVATYEDLSNGNLDNFLRKFEDE